MRGEGSTRCAPVDCSLFPDGVVMSGMPSGIAIVSDREQRRERWRRVLLRTISLGPPSFVDSILLSKPEQLNLVLILSYVDGLLCEYTLTSCVPLQIQEATPIARQQQYGLLTLVEHCDSSSSSTSKLWRCSARGYHVQVQAKRQSEVSFRERESPRCQPGRLVRPRALDHS